MTDYYDVIIIGGGALGSFHAYHALKKGLKVVLVEKDGKPKGATTRNFGQVVPSGFNTKWQNYGRESLKIYKEIQTKFDITVKQEGTVYLASNNEEEELLTELAAINKTNDYQSKILTKNQCLTNYPGLSSNYVKSGLFFPEELVIEPLTMIHKLHNYMVQEMGLTILYNYHAVHSTSIGDNVFVTDSKKRKLKAKKTIICNGSDFNTLYPEIFENSALEISKLQMMQTKPQQSYHLKGSVLTGWSIRRYESFKECASYTKIKRKEANDSLQKKWEVHILFKQAIDGSIIIGDSHEYADVENAVDVGYDLNMDIDNFILSEAKKIITLPNYDIQRRWYGIYSQCKNQDIFTKIVGNNIHIITGIGGKGMTGSAGFSKESINTIFNF